MEQASTEILEVVESSKYVLESEILVREVKITLNIECLNPTVGIKVWLISGLEGAEYTYTLSHYFKTPTQISAYRPGSRSHSTEQSTIEAAISALTMHYPEAINNGHEPDESWLIANPDY